MDRQMNYTSLDYLEPYYGFYSSKGHYLDYAVFDPWTGVFIKENYRACYSSVEDEYLNSNEPGIKTINVFIKRMYTKLRQQHNGLLVCTDLDDKVNPYKGMTRLTYIPTIRTYAFFRKTEKGVFDALDYCPFCGAKLPERLDEKLTEILQTKYGLKSWRDYKKAPHEFHTDEWWKKRGL